MSLHVKPPKTPSQLVFVPSIAISQHDRIADLRPQHRCTAHPSKSDENGVASDHHTHTHTQRNLHPRHVHQHQTSNPQDQRSIHVVPYKQSVSQRGRINIRKQGRPAYAGVYPYRCAHTTARSRSPRVCGGLPTPALPPNQEKKVAPRTRGFTIRMLSGEDPTYALGNVGRPVYAGGYR